MASRFLVRGVTDSCGRVTVAPGALLRGSDAPDRPQSSNGFLFFVAAFHSGNGAWVAPSLRPEYRAAEQRIRPTRCSSRPSPFPASGVGVSARPRQSRAWAGPGGYRLPFTSRPARAPSSCASAHRGAGSAPHNSALQRTRRQSPLAPSSSPLSAVSLDAPRRPRARCARPNQRPLIAKKRFW